MNSSKLPYPARLLGATCNLGTVTAADPHGVYVLITDAHGLEHHRFVSQLEHVTLSVPRPFEKITRRIGYGTWDEVYSLFPHAPLAQAA